MVKDMAGLFHMKKKRGKHNETTIETCLCLDWENNSECLLSASSLQKNTGSRDCWAYTRTLLVNHPHTALDSADSWAVGSH